MYFKEITYFLCPLLFVLVAYFYYNFLKLKKYSSTQIEVLSEEISVENKVANQLKNNSKKIAQLNLDTHLKCFKIKVHIINISFTLKELF